MSDQKLLHPRNVVKTAKNRCKSAQTSTKILVYKSEIWSKNHLPCTKSDCIGFRITSGIPVVSYASYVAQEGQNTATGGCIRKC